VTSTVSVAGVKIINGETYNSTYVNGAGIVGSFAAKYPGVLGNSLKVAVCDSALFQLPRISEDPLITNLPGFLNVSVAGL
jgi:hypothetical protein